MNIKGILFDKDGTLMDFNAFWVAIAQPAVSRLLSSLHLDASLSEPFLDAIGISGGTCRIDGSLSYGTYTHVAQDFCRVLKKENIPCRISDIIEKTIYFFNACSHLGCIRPTGDLHRLFQHLKEKGIKIGLATADDISGTKMCLEALSIEPYFDFIATDDGIMPPKPHPAIIEQFCGRFCLLPEEVCMVGDTVTDMKFANNSGAHPIGLANHPLNRALLLKHTRHVITDLSELTHIIS